MMNDDHKTSHLRIGCDFLSIYLRMIQHNGCFLIYTPFHSIYANFNTISFHPYDIWIIFYA